MSVKSFAANIERGYHGKIEIWSLLTFPTYGPKDGILKNFKKAYPSERYLGEVVEVPKLKKKVE